ncbi:hypothetical protein LCGC14_1041250 [marine sediment metagenome]|uniref:Uncharacterized protein n=1 Tax=marine sediment metagenome TaxID=412755 RepID=A0A0F9NDD8_9ZZZZ
MIFWKGVSKAVHEVTGNCLSKSDCIAIAKNLNATTKAQADRQRKGVRTTGSFCRCPSCSKLDAKAAVVSLLENG